MTATRAEALKALNEARDGVFALCEATEDEAIAALRKLSDEGKTESEPHVVGFYRGRKAEAKGISRAMAEVFRDLERRFEKAPHE